MNIIKINGQIFNKDWAESVTEKKFVDNLMPAPFWKDDPEKESKLKDAWRLINGKQPKTAKNEGAE